ncbi:MAG TPA: CinA family nicotinamide mononucleotide deamidase-related protein [Anaerolineales bacterium]
MTQAEILTIGTELLLGEIIDTNTQTIARELRAIGLDLYRTGAVGDNVERIAEAVREASQRAEVVITAGGLGPTVDDYTREAIARAFGLDLEFHPDLWEQIQERFARFGLQPPENNRRQAMLPTGAVAIENPVGTAPAFRVVRRDRVVIALPGVPAELKHLLEVSVIPFLRKTRGLTGVIKSRLIRTAGVGESWLDERIGDLERLTNPTVGLAAHPGRVDIRITAKAASEPIADEQLAVIEATLRGRLTDRIYGIDSETLETAALQVVARAGWRLAVVEAGTGGALSAALAQHSDESVAGKEVLSSVPSAEAGRQALERVQASSGAQVGLLLILKRNGEHQTIELTLRWPGGSQDWQRTYGGAPLNAPDWATSLALDYLRRHMTAESS